MRRSVSRVFHANTVALFGILFLTLSCSREDEVVSERLSKEQYEDHVQFLVRSGFDRDHIVYEKGTFIIEDDILISKEDVEGYMALDRSPDQGRTEHYRGTYLVSDSYVTNIKFFISTSVTSSWAAAIRQGIEQWNNVNGTKLFLSEVSSSSQANTVINTGYSSSNWVARAYLPSWRGRPGHTLTINTRYNSLDSGRKLFTMVHEMGHIFGFYHTDQTQGVFIQGTPVSDPNSVMNSFVLPWNGFTAGDVTAVQIIYPD